MFLKTPHKFTGTRFRASRTSFKFAARHVFELYLDVLRELAAHNTCEKDV